MDEPLLTRTERTLQYLYQLDDDEQIDLGGIDDAVLSLEYETSGT
jgi:hypothetical protein